MAPKVALRRPAARAGGLRRPAARGDDEPGAAAEVPPRILGQLTLQELQKLGNVRLRDAKYYGRVVQVAGRMCGTRLEDGQLYAELEATGTQDDELLRVLSGAPGRKLSIHLCSEDCAGTLTDPLLIHGRSVEEVDLKDVPWLTNLEAVRGDREAEIPDEMTQLRALQAKAKEKEGDDKKKQSKKEKKKGRGEELTGEEGRLAKAPKKQAAGFEVGQKDLEAIYAFTGLDLDPARRRKVLKRAKRLGKAKKKKKKSSSSSGGGGSSSSTSSSSSSGGDSGLFGEDTKLAKIWKRCPGALTAGGVREARQGLLNQAGTLWNIDQEEVPAIFTQYCRQQIMQPHAVSAAMSQELLTLSQAVDFLLLGKPAGAADILCQRIKSLEALAKGSHWSTGRQLELIRADHYSIAEGSEALGAARRAREEERLKNLLSKAPSSKGGDNSHGGKNRKGKSAGKGKPDEGGKNRGGDGRGRDDGKNAAKK